MSIGDIIGVSGASTFVRDEIATLTDERDRARELAASLEQICAERERLLWLAIEVHPTFAAEAAAWNAIGDHLEATGSRPLAEQER